MSDYLVIKELQKLIYMVDEKLSKVKNKEVEKIRNEMINKMQEVTRDVDKDFNFIRSGE